MAERHLTLMHFTLGNAKEISFEARDVDIEYACANFSWRVKILVVFRKNSSNMQAKQFFLERMKCSAK
jgi:hypothetical protein